MILWILQLFGQKHATTKYNSSSCYKSFLRDMAKTGSVTITLNYKTHLLQSLQIYQSHVARDLSWEICVYFVVQSEHQTVHM